jgi:hypothetical protein
MAVIADYLSMCALVGPLDFDAFCDGYTCYSEWKAARENADTVPLASLRGERLGSAPYAA